MKFYLLFYVIGFALLSTGSDLFAEEKNAAQKPVTIQDIIEGMQNYEKQFLELDSWWIEYSQVREMHHLPPGFNPNYPKMKWVNARSGSVEYLHQYIFNKKNPEKSENSWYIWKDAVSARYHDRENFTIFPIKIPEFFQDYFYLDTLFLNIYKAEEKFSPLLAQGMGVESAAKLVEPFELPDSVISHLDKYTLKEKTENVGGSECHVLVWEGRDELWIDTNHGFVCCKRNMYLEGGAPFIKVENLELSDNNAKKIWLPQKQTRAFYNSEGSGPAFSGKLRYIEINELIKADLGNIDADLLKIPKPQDAFVHDAVRNKTYVIREGGDNPEKRIDQAIQDAPILQGSPIKVPTSNMSLTNLLLLNGIIVVGIGCWFLIRRKS